MLVIGLGGLRSASGDGASTFIFRGGVLDSGTVTSGIVRAHSSCTRAPAALILAQERPISGPRSPFKRQRLAFTTPSEISLGTIRLSGLVSALTC